MRSRMAIRFFDAVRRIVALPLAELGWSAPRRAQGDVEFVRQMANSSQMVLFQRSSRGLPYGRFTVELLWRGDSPSERRCRLGKAALLPQLSDFWHFDSRRDLEEWLEFLLPYLLREGMAWLDAQPETDEARWNRIERWQDMGRQMMAYFGVTTPEQLSHEWKMWHRWAMVRVPWYREYIVGGNPGLPEVEPPWLRR